MEHLGSTIHCDAHGPFLQAVYAQSSVLLKVSRIIDRVILYYQRKKGIFQQ